jgi:drug/metabolite transporter (DMT)-like permease
VPEQARTVTYVKLIAAMAMWGGTWIAGRVIAQELSAPLAVAALRFVLSGLAVGGFMLLSEGRLPFRRAAVTGD